MFGLGGLTSSLFPEVRLFVWLIFAGAGAVGLAVLYYPDMVRFFNPTVRALREYEKQKESKRLERLEPIIQDMKKNPLLGKPTIIDPNPDALHIEAPFITPRRVQVLGLMLRLRVPVRFVAWLGRKLGVFSVESPSKCANTTFTY